MQSLKLHSDENSAVGRFIKRIYFTKSLYKRLRISLNAKRDAEIIVHIFLADETIEEVDLCSEDLHRMTSALTRYGPKQVSGELSK